MGLPGDSQNTVDMTVSSSTTSQQLIQQAVKRMDKPVDSTHLKLLVTNKNTKGQSVPMVVGDLYTAKQISGAALIQLDSQQLRK